MADPLQLLLRIPKAESAEERTADLEALSRLVSSGEFRDTAYTRELYAALFALITAAVSWKGATVKGDVQKAEAIFWGAVRFPEFDASVAEQELSEDFFWTIAGRADGTAAQEEWPFLRDVLLWLYRNFVPTRAKVRSLVGRTLSSFGHFAHKGAPIAPLLQVLAPIIRGFRQPFERTHRSLFNEVLLPLHKPNDWLQWDRQTPLLATYHKELLLCLELFLEKQPSLALRCLEVVCVHFPQARESNTPKDVLLIFEIGRLCRYVDSTVFQQALPKLLKHFTRLLASQNAQPIQAVLQLWKDDHFVELCRGASEVIVPRLLPSLLRDGELFWNPTVNRMTSLVLEKLEQSNPPAFERAAESIWGPGGQVPAFEIPEPAPPADEDEDEAKPATGKHAAAARGPNVASLKFRMGDWKPPSGPSSAGTRGPGGQPPLTTTGVAPWAVQRQGFIGNSGSLKAKGFGGAPSGSSAGGTQPPLTTTGVAPWAFQPHQKVKSASGGLPPPAGGRAFVRPDDAGLSFAEEDEEEDDAKGQSGPPPSGIERVHEYMRRLCPQGADATTGEPSWEAALSAETPTLLPTLKFHQLVFGHEDLGVGAFSVVKYARAVQQETTQSQWPEYAVKVINTNTMEDLGYEGSVNREICVLRMLSHPGIARMVSAFRWREGAYLVLEYAKKGDLHNILMQHGKLDKDTAAFFLGETIAALSVLHDIGFVYADLKPENIVITATNHAKLTDFGGCRPITDEARQRTRQSLVRRLRDGDWRVRDETEDAEPEEAADIDESPALEAADDLRVEGTTLYLPPEVVRGAAPTLAADAWALGCLVYRMLTGRPPVWAESEREEDLRSRIVSFRLTDSGVLDDLHETAHGLTTALLEPDSTKRLSVAGAANDPFFDGLDVFTLYRRPRGPSLPTILATASVAPASDERWQKRQFSKIWTVLPSAQDYAPPPMGNTGGEGAAALIAETDLERACPFAEDALPSIPGPGGGGRRIESL